MRAASTIQTHIELQLMTANDKTSQELRAQFDRHTERAGTGSIKWQFHVSDGRIIEWDRTDASHGEDQVLPMWVADMDFQAAPAIHEAVMSVARHGVYGYTAPTSEYFESVCAWMHRRQDWYAEPDWVVPCPGIVPAFHLAVRRFTEPGDKVLIQRPVYHPFTYAAETNGRIPVSNTLRLANGRYEMDFDDLERKAADPAVKIALLCSPHNPVGRVWTYDELNRFARICTNNDVLIVADEIHADLTMPGFDFIAFGKLERALRENAIICTAPSKAFNLAGLQASNMVISNEALRESMRAELRSCGLFTLNPFGLAAVRAAYDDSEDWLDAALSYINDNLDRLESFASAHLPGIKVIRPQGTYLAWLDCRGLGLNDADLGTLFMDKAKLYLDEGHIFGPEGSGFMRLNVACPRSILDTALERLRQAISAG